MFHQGLTGQFSQQVVIRRNRLASYVRILLQGFAQPRIAGDEQRQEGDQRVVVEMQLEDEASGDGIDQRPMRDARAELRGLAVFLVDVQRVVVARQAGKHHDVGFGDGASRADKFLADLSFFTVQASHNLHSFSVYRCEIRFFHLIATAPRHGKTSRGVRPSTQL